MRKGMSRFLDSQDRKLSRLDGAMGAIQRKARMPLASGFANAQRIQRQHPGMTGIVCVTDTDGAGVYFRLMPGRMPVSASADDFSKEPADSGFDIGETLERDAEVRANVARVTRQSDAMVRKLFKLLERDARSEHKAKLATMREQVKKAHAAGTHTFQRELNVVGFGVIRLKDGTEIDTGSDIQIERCVCGCERIVRDGKPEAPFRFGRKIDASKVKRGRGRPRKDEARL